jgi:hypothetical protein
MEYQWFEECRSSIEPFTNRQDENTMKGTAYPLVRKVDSVSLMSGTVSFCIFASLSYF